MLLANDGHCSSLVIGEWLQVSFQPCRWPPRLHKKRGTLAGSVCKVPSIPDPLNFCRCLYLSAKTAKVLESPPTIDTAFYLHVLAQLNFALLHCLIRADCSAKARPRLNIPQPEPPALSPKLLLPQRNSTRWVSLRLSDGCPTSTPRSSRPSLRTGRW